MSDPIAIAAALKQRAAAAAPPPKDSKPSLPSNIPWYLRDDNKWSLSDDKSQDPHQNLNIKAAGAAATLIAMYFTGHVERALERKEEDSTISMLSAFLVFLCLSVISKCITMHIREWVASAKIRLDAKRKARAAQEASDAGAESALVSSATNTAASDSTGGAGIRKRSGKTKKT